MRMHQPSSSFSDSLTFLTLADDFNVEASLGYCVESFLVELEFPFSHYDYVLRLLFLGVHEAAESL